MLVKFVLPTQPAGSVGGLTYYKNGSSFAVRARAMPCKRQSNARVYALNLIPRLSVFWETPLTNAQRAGWGTYAYNSPLVDAYGAPRYIRGYAQYMRSNRPRLQFGLPRIDAPPSIYGFPTYTQPVCYLMPTNPITLDVYWTPADAWAKQTGAFMMLWGSSEGSPTVLTPQETYSPIGYIAGTSGTAPAQPATFVYPRNLSSAAANIWLRQSVTMADGRLSGL